MFHVCKVSWPGLGTEGVSHLAGDMQDSEIREAAQGNGLLDDGESGTDHCLASNACRCRRKHKGELQAAAGFSTESRCKVRAGARQYAQDVGVRLPARLVVQAGHRQHTQCTASSSRHQET